MSRTPLSSAPEGFRSCALLEPINGVLPYVLADRANSGVGVTRRCSWSTMPIDPFCIWLSLPESIVEG